MVYSGDLIGGDTLAGIAADAMRTAARKTLQYLERSQGWAKVALEEGVFHPGDDPVTADEEAQQCFVKMLNSHLAIPQLRIVDVVGEENLNQQHTRVPPGHRIIVLDPVDGSTQWVMMRNCHCVSALTLLADDKSHLHVESAIVVNPVHAFTLVNGTLTMGPTFDRAQDDVSLTSCLEDTLSNRTFAITGFKAKDRGSLLALLNRARGWDCFTVGGNPMTPYVMAGSLRCAVTWRPQFTWDAIGVLMATYSDAVIGDINGTVVDNVTFRARFDSVRLTQNAKVIPPMIVSKDLQSYDEMVEILRQARVDFGENFGSGME